MRPKVTAFGGRWQSHHRRLGFAQPPCRPRCSKAVCRRPPVAAVCSRRLHTRRFVCRRGVAAKGDRLRRSVAKPPPQAGWLGFAQPRRGPADGRAGEAARAWRSGADPRRSSKQRSWRSRGPPEVDQAAAPVAGPSGGRACRRGGRKEARPQSRLSNEAYGIISTLTNKLFDFANAAAESAVSEDCSPGRKRLIEDRIGRVVQTGEPFERSVANLFETLNDTSKRRKEVKEEVGEDGVVHVVEELTEDEIKALSPEEWAEVAESDRASPKWWDPALGLRLRLRSPITSSAWERKRRCPMGNRVRVKRN